MRKRERERARLRDLPDSYKKLGVTAQTKKTLTANHRAITREIIQHRTGHEDFESYQQRFDIEGIPMCPTDRAIRMDTLPDVLTRPGRAGDQSSTPPLLGQEKEEV